MKNILRYVLAFVIGIGVSLGSYAVAATITSIGKDGTSEYLLYNFDSLRANNFTASSSTSTNTFPRLSFTLATGTGATSTSLGISGILSSLLKTTSTGGVVAAVLGTDYINLSSLSASSPISYNNGTGAFSWTGLATTSQPSSSNLLVSNGGAGVYGVATTSATCSGNTTCTSFTVIGSSPITISSTGGGGVWPFTTGNTNFGVSVQSTSTPLWFTGGAGVYASGTSRLSDLVVYGDLNAMGLIVVPSLATPAGTFLAADQNGFITATNTPTINPAGAAYQVQYNTGSALGASANFQYDPSVSGFFQATAPDGASGGTGATVYAYGGDRFGATNIGGIAQISSGSNSTSSGAYFTAYGGGGGLDDGYATTGNAVIGASTGITNANGGEVVLIPGAANGAGFLDGIVVIRKNSSSLLRLGLDQRNITQNRVQTFQDKDGTIALLSDITGSGASSTLLGDANTFSGANIFNSITRSTTTYATTTSFFASTSAANQARFTTLTATGTSFLAQSSIPWITMTNSTTTNATSTSFFSSISSSTNLFATNANLGVVGIRSLTVDSCTGCGSGGGVWPFTVGNTNFGVAVQSTSTPEWFTAGVFASGTSRFADQITYGSSTSLWDNGVLYADVFSGSDACARINSAYAYATTGQRIIAPAGQKVCSTGINFSTAGKYVTLEFAPGQVYRYTGTGNMIKIDWGNYGNDALKKGMGIRGGDFVGDSAGIGLWMGGANGANGATIRDSRFFTFATGTVVDSNTWDMLMDDVTLQYNVKGLAVQDVTSPGNMGEGLRFNNMNISDCQTVERCVDLISSGASVSFPGLALDDAQMYVHDGNARVTLSACHAENPNSAGTGKYTFLYIESGSNIGVTVRDCFFLNGASVAGDSPYQFIQNGGNLVVDGNTFADYDLTMQVAVTNFGNGSLTALGNSIQGIAFTSGVATSTSLTNATESFIPKLNVINGTSSSYFVVGTTTGNGEEVFDVWGRASVNPFGIHNDIGTEILSVLNNGLMWLTGKLSIGTTTSRHKLNVYGRIDQTSNISCALPWNSNTAMTADSLGSATVPAYLCGAQLLYDMNTTGSIQPTSDTGMASGTPAMNVLRSGGLTWNFSYMKTPGFIGSATSTNGDGIAMSGWFRTPNVSTASTTFTYSFGFSSTTAVSTTSPHQYTFTPATSVKQAGCMAIASSTQNWQLVVADDSGTFTQTDTGFATSTSAFMASLIMNGTGCSVTFNNATSPHATISSGLPTKWMRGVVGVGSTGAGGLGTQGYLGVGNLRIWTMY